MSDIRLAAFSAAAGIAGFAAAVAAGWDWPALVVLAVGWTAAAVWAAGTRPVCWLLTPRRRRRR